MKLTKKELRTMRDALELLLEDERRFGDDAEGEGYYDALALMGRVRDALEA